MLGVAIGSVAAVALVIVIGLIIRRSNGKLGTSAATDTVRVCLNELILDMAFAVGNIRHG